MKLTHKVLNSLVSIAVTFIFCLPLTLFPLSVSAENVHLASEVSDVVKSFSQKYCVTISNGDEPQNAIQVVSRQMISGLIFSGVLKEVMSVPKDDMAFALTSAIFDGCGSELAISREELNDYLIQLAEKGTEQAESEPRPFKPFGMD